MTSAQRLHGQDRASCGAQWPQCGAQTVSAALPQKTHGETTVLCVIMIYYSPIMTYAQRLHGQDRASFGAQWPQCGAQTVSAALPQKTYGETPVLCAIMIYYSPIMTSAQRLHGQDRASFGAQWPQCGAQAVSAALPQKTRGVTTALCAIMIYHSPIMTSARRLHGQDRASFGALQCGSIVSATMWGTNCECSIAAKNTW